MGVLLLLNHQKHSALKASGVLSHAPCSSSRQDAVVRPAFFYALLRAFVFWGSRREIEVPGLVKAGHLVCQ